MEFNEIKHHPQSLDEVKLKPISPYRRRNTSDRIYNKLGDIWNNDSNNKQQ